MTDTDADLIDSLVQEGVLSKDAGRRFKAAAKVAAERPYIRVYVVAFAWAACCSVLIGVGGTEWMPQGVRVAASMMAALGTVSALVAFFMAGDQRKRDDERDKEQQKSTLIERETELAKHWATLTEAEQVAEKKAEIEFKMGRELCLTKGCFGDAHARGHCWKHDK